MDLVVRAIDEGRCTRVVIQGEAPLGRLCSLMRVLEVDSASWRHPQVLLDLRELRSRLDHAERAMLREVAGLRLRSRSVTLLWPAA
jgi:hypothetical protein